MSLYYTIQDTINSTSGANLSGTTANITITPVNPTTNIHSGAFLDASNFKVGGATETNGSGAATAGTNIYEGGNVDTGISKVTLTNNGTTGDINNTVNAAVLFGSVSPSASGALNIDIDERTDNPIATTPPRKVCFELRYDYDTRVIANFYQPASMNSWVVAPNPFQGITRTQLDDGTSSGVVKWKFEGTINNYILSQNYNLIRVGFLRASGGVAIDTLPAVGSGPTEPSFDPNNFFFTQNTTNITASNPFFAQAYSSQNFQILNSNDQPYILAQEIYYNPVDPQNLLTSDIFAFEQGDWCAIQGAVVNCEFDVFQPAEELAGDFIIRNLDAPRALGSTPRYEAISVIGTPGATYNLNLVRTVDAETDTIAATGGYYNFAAGLRGFQDTPCTNVYTIGESGEDRHYFFPPKSASEIRYDVFVTPTLSTRASSNVPTKIADKSIIKEGLSSITVSVTPRSSDSFDINNLSGSAVTSKSFTRRRSARASSNHYKVIARSQGAISSSKVLVLDDVYPAIENGMFVISPFFSGSDDVPHLTTVTVVKNNIVKLSANCTISDNSEIIFITPSQRTIPFNFVLPAGGTLGSELIASDPADNRTFDNDTGNWAVHDPSGGSAASISRDASTSSLLVNATSDSAIEGASLAIAHVGDGSTTSVVAGQVYRISVDLKGTKAISDMRVGIGGAISSAFAITTSFVTYTFEITAANNTGALLVYTDGSSSNDFYIDNVSVKRNTLKDLALISTSSTDYRPQTSLGGTKSSVRLIAGSVGTSANIVMSSSTPVDDVTDNMILTGGSISHNGTNSVSITAINRATNTLTVASSQTFAKNDEFIASLDTSVANTVSTKNVELMHVHAAITTSSGTPADNREVAQVYGYITARNPNNSVTLPFFPENLISVS